MNVKMLFTMAFLGIVISCKSKKIQSKDLLFEEAFTSGIEGPAVDPNGNLYAVNFKKEGTVGIVYENGRAEVFLKLPGKSVGNGIRFDQEGDMYIADYVGHNIYRVKNGSKVPEVWAHHADMNQPNDLAIAPNGTLYLSDPNWSKGTGKLWMVRASKHNPSRGDTPQESASEDRSSNVNTSAVIVLLEEDMGTTNGIEVSPDGSKLYVNESVQRKVWQYDIEPNGTLSHKTEFHIFDDFGLDGMRCDMAGNLYITRYDKGTVAIISPDKKIIKEVHLKGKKPSNLTFGGPEGKTCFVTMADRGCFETFKALNSGAFYSRIN